MHLEQMFLYEGNPYGEGWWVDTGNISNIGTELYTHQWGKYCQV